MVRNLEELSWAVLAADTLRRRAQENNTWKLPSWREKLPLYIGLEDQRQERNNLKSYRLEEIFTEKEIFTKKLELLNIYYTGHGVIIDENIYKNPRLQNQDVLHHFNYIEDIINGKLKDQPLTLEPTKHTELSAEYAYRLALMDKTIAAEELKALVPMIRVGPLVSAALMLGEWLSDKTKQLPEQVRQKSIDLLHIYAATTSPETDIGRVLQAELSEEATVEVFDPGRQTVEQFNALLRNNGACTYSPNSNLATSPAAAFAADSKAGGSVHFQFSGKTGSSYNRLYLAVDREGTPLLFYDCAESGDLTRATIDSYVRSGNAEALIGSFAASIIIANRLGLEKVAFGELEMVDLVRHLGLGERKIFTDEPNPGQKLGYVGGVVCNGRPHLWKMDHDKAFRVANPQLFTPAVLPSVVNQANQVMERIRTNPKSRKTLRNDYQRFFSIIDTIYEEAKPLLGEVMYQRLHRDVSSFCEEYKLRLHESEGDGQQFQPLPPLLPTAEQLPAHQVISQVA